MPAVCNNNSYCTGMTYAKSNVSLPKYYKNSFDKNGLFTCDDGTVIKEINYAAVSNNDDTNTEILQELYGQTLVGKKDFVISDYIKNIPDTDNKKYTVGYTCAPNTEILLNSLDNNLDDPLKTFNDRKSNIYKNQDYNVYVSKPEYINWNKDMYGYDEEHNTVDFNKINSGGVIFTKDYITEDNPPSGDEVSSLDECINLSNKSENISGSYLYKHKDKYFCNPITNNTIKRRSSAMSKTNKNIPEQIIYIKPGNIPTIIN